jgi:LmbE family N-acetylglucosaminyl deacetylase
MIIGHRPGQRSHRSWGRLANGGLAALAVLLMGGPTARAELQTNSAAAILQELQSFREMGSVLYVAAHPDDENTTLIAYLARGRNYRTAYLSLTRGDGGQNVLGPDFGEKLGVARTQELLAARGLDGGRQYFSRAMDFGFSKDYLETLRIWDKQEVLSDIVRVIREFRPDVVITRFSTVPGGTHGHHTASAVLALEAFKEAGDTNAFPDQLDSLSPWQPKRIMVNGHGGDSQVHLDTSGTDPVLGISFGELAARSRAMHKTQGFDNFRGGGGHTESFQMLAGDVATNDILDGVDTTWGRYPAGEEIGKMADEIITNFNPQNVSASVPGLLKLRATLEALPTTDPVVKEKRAQLDRILQACLGLEVSTTISRSEVVPGETMQLHQSVIVHSDLGVRWLAVRYPASGSKIEQAVELTTNELAVRDSTQTLPMETPLTQPYWLRKEGTAGMFRVDDPSLIGRPENPPVFPVEYIFEVGNQTFLIPDEPVQIKTNAAGNEIRQKLDVIPPVSLKFATDVELFSPGASNVVEVAVTAARSGTAGTLQLEAPAGWTVSPTKQYFNLSAVGEQARLQFIVTAPGQSTTAKIVACAEISGVQYRNEREKIAYPHIPRQLLQPVASLKAVSLDLAIRGQTVGYLPGAGDSVAAGLAQIGYKVKMLDDKDITAEGLKGLDAVVIGVRAFNVRTNLAPQMPALFAYVTGGGTVIAQYNRPDGLKVKTVAPFDLHLSGQRVTDETAAMTFLAPDHPALNSPNKITAADFDGWVQERGIYFPDQWDEHFTPILAANDPGEAPLKGGLLVAQSGKGYYVYTGLVFFRQLPAGVPGAYRLLANLISLGK